MKQPEIGAADVLYHGLRTAKYPFDKSPIDEQQVALCREWITRFTVPTANLNRTTDSYNLKHDVERWAKKYISTGAFIIAAIREGYRS